MGRSAGVSRREALTAGLLVAALGLGIGGYTFYREADNARLRKQVEESRIIASRGEWVGIEADGIDYAGTLGVTLLASARYDTLTEAEEAGELGALNEFDVHDGAYIVCEVELDGKDIHVKDGGNNVLNVTILQLMYPGGQTTIHASSVWTSGEPANDEMAGIYGIRFGEGDIVTVRLGFSLPKGVDSDGLRLVYYSRQYQFLLDFENQQARLGVSMNRILRIEMRRALTNRWFVLSLVTLTIMAMVSAVVGIVSVTSGLDVVVYPYLDTSYWYVTSYSSYRYWIAVNRMSAPIEAFFALAPLLVLMGYSWSAASDHKSGYCEQLLARSGKTSWYTARYLAVFASGGLLVSIPLLVNFLLLALFIPSWQPSVVDMFYMGVSCAADKSDDALFTEVLSAHAPLYMVAKIALDFALCGAWCVCVLAISLVVRNRVALIVVPYLALLLVKHLGQRLYVVMRSNGAVGFGRSFTLFDQLRASPDGFYCPGWLTLACLAAMIVFSIALPCLCRRRDVL